VVEKLPEGQLGSVDRRREAMTRVRNDEGDALTVQTEARHTGFMTCWAGTREPPYKRVGGQQVPLGWIAPTGPAHAFTIGRTLALCGAERAYDNGQHWPPPDGLVAEGLCVECVEITGLGVAEPGV
jgi:hypothetical protein